MSWIEYFDAAAEPIEDYIDAYENYTHEPISLQVADGIQIALTELAISANPAPSDTFDSQTKEQRGWVRMCPVVSFCDPPGPGLAKSWNAGVTHSAGFTPVRSSPGATPITFLDGESPGPIISDNGLGRNCITITVKHQARIGSAGQMMNAILTRTGVPYRWGKIEYTLCANSDYTIVYSASHFPSHKAYLRDVAVAFRAQADLPAFLFSGGRRDGPGSAFYTASGNVNGPNLPGN
jgi:hypothetical protein